jgi:ribosome-binding protein aMBF1 (putative translation factor)
MGGMEPRYSPEQRKELSKRVKACRRRLLMNRKEFAALIGVATATVESMESVDREVTYRSARKFLAFESKHLLGPMDKREERENGRAEFEYAVEHGRS